MRLKNLVELGIILTFTIGILSGCAPRYAYIPAYPPPSKKVEIGLASWYGSDFHGRKTASGEIYNMYDITAAHKTLPLGTHAMVTNLDNGRSVKVEINDRGPFVEGRIIDLSYAAARILDMVEEGVVKVRLEVLREGKGKYVSSPSSYTIQVGSFINKLNADNLKERLEEIFPEVYITIFDTSGSRYYQVRVGNFRSRDLAYRTAKKLAKMDFPVFILVY